MKILRAPELWLTPLIGLAVLTYFVHHHGLKLYGSWIVCVLAGVVPLLATGVVQGMFKLLPWPGWAQVLLSCVVGCVVGYLILAFVYYHALFPPGLLDGDIDEGRANDIALYNWQTDTFGTIGGGAAGLSALLGGLMSRLKRPASR